MTNQTGIALRALVERLAGLEPSLAVVALDSVNPNTVVRKARNVNNVLDLPPKP